MTGSGMPMRFADQDGSKIDVYQAATQMTDESQQSYPFTPDTLLDRALGTEGYYGAFTANLHTDSPTEFESDQVIASAQARQVPVVSSRQMLSWLDGRNGSSFKNLSYSGNTLSFSVDAAAGANGLTAMVPTASDDGTLSSLSLNGSPVSYRTETIKGLEYAIFQSDAGTYEAHYSASAPSAAIASSAPSLQAMDAQTALTAPATATATAPTLSGVQALALPDGTASIDWTSSQDAAGTVDFAASTSALTDQRDAPAATTTPWVVLTRLKPGERVYYRVAERN